jgi:hypothetical protein
MKRYGILIFTIFGILLAGCSVDNPEEIAGFKASQAFEKYIAHCGNIFYFNVGKNDGKDLIIAFKREWMTQDNETSESDKLNGIAYKGIYYYSFNGPSRIYYSATGKWTQWAEDYTHPNDYYHLGKLYVEKKKDGRWKINDGDLGRSHKELTCNDIPR